MPKDITIRHFFNEVLCNVYYCTDVALLSNAICPLVTSTASGDRFLPPSRTAKHALPSAFSSTLLQIQAAIDT